MQQCISEDVKIHEPMELWVLNAKNYQSVWSDSSYEGQDGSWVCPPIPETPEIQTSGDPNRPDLDIPNDYGVPYASLREFENSHP